MSALFKSHKVTNIRDAEYIGVSKLLRSVRIKVASLL